MTGINDLVSGVIYRIDEIPSSITGSPVIYALIDDARKDVQNITGESISASSVPEKYQSILSNLGTVYTLSRMTGVGVDFSYKLGNFNIDKGKASDANASQMEFLISMANKSLNMIGVKIPFRATFQ